MNENLQENWLYQLVMWIRELPYADTKRILYEIVFKYERYVKDYTIRKRLQHISKSDGFSQGEADLLQHWNDYFSCFSHEELLIIDSLMGFKDIYNMHINRDPATVYTVFVSLVIDLEDIGKRLIEVGSPREKPKSKLSKNRSNKSKKIKAIALIILVFSSSVIGIVFTIMPLHLQLSLDANVHLADVNEDIEFGFQVIGNYYNGILIFGDGSILELDGSLTSASHKYALQGKYRPTLIAFNNLGELSSKTIPIEIKNLAPHFEINLLGRAKEDEMVQIKISNLMDSDHDLQNSQIMYLYDFADGNQTLSNSSMISHSWKNTGVYPMSVSAIDDQRAISRIEAEISIENEIPEADYNFTIDANKVVCDVINIADTPSDISSLTFLWDFDDDHAGFGKHVMYYFSHIGVYQVELQVVDDNGARSGMLKSIQIDELKYLPLNESEEVEELEVMGPFCISNAIEGQVIELNVETQAPFKTQPNLRYIWKDSTGTQLSSYSNPSLMFDDGIHKLSLNITDGSEISVENNVKVIVENVAPEVFVTDYCYFGPSSPRSDLGDRTGEVELVAHARDSRYDIEHLRFQWSITNGRETYTYDEFNPNAMSIFAFKCTESIIYRGQVKVSDPSGKMGSCEFKVYSTIDQNHNGVSDSIDAMLDITKETLYSFTDSDGDGLSNLYETSVLRTNPYNPDSDGDGVVDGIGPNGVGELVLGTSAIQSDTDHDGLSDSKEHEGWMVQITTLENTNNYHVSSDPLISDTDMDGLSDYEEFLNGTDPRVPDSDKDGLSDLLDPFPIHWDTDNDGLSDKEELDLGTGLNNSDTDNDGIYDGSEVKGWGPVGFQTDPLDPDGDRDFAADGSEVKSYTKKLESDQKGEVRVNVSNPVTLFFPYLFQEASAAQISLGISFGEHDSDSEQEYGIEESNIPDLEITVKHRESGRELFQERIVKNRYFATTIDLASSFNNKTRPQNYYGHYILEVNDSSASCLVERFQIDACRYLDPHDEDFDDDGILDGVEMDLLVEGKQKIDVNDYYTAGDLLFNSTRDARAPFKEFSLEIPLIGRIEDAKVSFNIESLADLQEPGNMTIYMVKKPLNPRLEEIYVYDQFRFFIPFDDFEHRESFYLSDVYALHSMKSMLGRYSLRIQALTSGNNTTPFILKEFSIETDTFVKAGPLDDEAWFTDPSLNDTDHDGWSDYHEIFESKTNPICKDTDQDGAIDSRDWDPLRNVVLQVIPINAAYMNQLLPTFNPYLQIGVSLQINDLEDPEVLKEDSTVGFFTPSKQTTTGLNAVGSYQVAWWDGYQYHVDISDDMMIQSGTVQFKFTLWEDILTGDLNRFDNKWQAIPFQFSSVGDQSDLRVTHVGGLGFTDEINVRVRLLGIERCNTIAIYHENETTFNGHYQEPERVNVFQLHVIDSGDGTPFVQGANCIVIPTSIFSKTVLNGYIENDRLSETPLYSSVEGEYEFYSIDRDGSVQEDGTGEVDFVFVRNELTAQQAMEILTMLLNCSVSQGLDENNNTITKVKRVHDYTSTKLHGIDAVRLNLPTSTSRFALWDSEQEDSPYGATPEPFNPFFVFLYLLMLMFPPAKLPILFTITMIAITQLNDKSASTIGLLFITTLAKLVWCAIRTALLVISYLMLAIEVLTTSIIIAGIGSILSLTPLSCEWGLTWNIPYGVDTTFGFVHFELFDQVTKIKATINWTYWEYFDIYFPLLHFDTELGTMFEDFVEAGEQLTYPPELGCGFDHVYDLKYDFHATYRQYPQGYPPTYVNVTLVDPQGGLHHYSMKETYPAENINYADLVRFNKTIDFGEEFSIQERQGQWHYFFTTMASMTNCTTRWPLYGFAIGPCFNDWRPYFISSTLEPYYGRINEMFTFSTTGGDSMDHLTPNNIWLKIMWPNDTLQAFPMNSYAVYQVFNDTYTIHRIELNFSQYLGINAPTSLKHYFEAKFPDGTSDVLWDQVVIEDSIDYENEDAEYTLDWFKGPILLPQVMGSNAPPIIRNWYVEDLTWNRMLHAESPSRVLSPISEEFVLRFWVYIEDPDGSYLDHWENGFAFQPKLLLTNLDTPNASISPIPMKFTGGNYGPGPEGYDEYFVDLWGDGCYAYKYEETQDLIKSNFTSGAWTFAFSVTDNQSHHVQMDPEKKIWHIGSFDRMINTLFYGHPTGTGLGGMFGSIATTIGYIMMTILAACKKPALQVAAQVVAAGIAVADIVFNFMSFFSFVFDTKDMGAVLGLGFNLLLKSVGLVFSLSMSEASNGIFNFNFVQSFSGILMMLNFFDLFAETSHFVTQEDENGNEYLVLDQDAITWDDLLGGYPMMIVSFLSSIMGLTASLTITSGVARFGVGAQHVKKIIMAHVIISLLMAGLCFTAFFINSGFRHVAYDLLFSGLTAVNWDRFGNLPFS